MPHDVKVVSVFDMAVLWGCGSWLCSFLRLSSSTGASSF